ncbi:MAG: peptide deformylase [Candidatus Marinimicrobia bacterium]|nr:peptide deformylase [Candidatus Neomarinimicrobiota bacterium]MCF7827572.1 peptide deformylase [Candidatus Neomarinimicrobiota bacterium]MCF7881566.1 peptide deformylase [Candidatus Neomarinimicrobiota bacterium]
MSRSSRLRIYPDHVLREHALPVTNITDELRTLVDEMILLMDAYQGIGLAAPQVGILQRLIVIKDEDEFLTLVNPEIHHREDKYQLEEGCLSLPGIQVNVTREYIIQVEAMDISGNPLEFEAEDLPARIIQHEVDHLDGVLIIDHASTIERHLLKRQLRELTQEQ